MLPGEKQRERVLTAEEEQKYLDAATNLGREFENAYSREGRSQATPDVAGSHDRYPHLRYLRKLRPAAVD